MFCGNDKNHDETYLLTTSLGKRMSLNAWHNIHITTLLLKNLPN